MGNLFEPNVQIIDNKAIPIEYVPSSYHVISPASIDSCITNCVTLFLFQVPFCPSILDAHRCAPHSPPFHSRTSHSPLSRTQWLSHSARKFSFSHSNFLHSSYRANTSENLISTVSSNSLSIVTFVPTLSTKTRTFHTPNRSSTQFPKPRKCSQRLKHVVRFLVFHLLLVYMRLVNLTMCFYQLEFSMP